MQAEKTCIYAALFQHAPYVEWMKQEKALLHYFPICSCSFYCSYQFLWTERKTIWEVNTNLGNIAIMNLQTLWNHVLVMFIYSSMYQNQLLEDFYQKHLYHSILIRLSKFSTIVHTKVLYGVEFSLSASVMNVVSTRVYCKLHRRYIGALQFRWCRSLWLLMLHLLEAMYVALCKDLFDMDGALHHLFWKSSIEGSNMFWVY